LRIRRLRAERSRGAGAEPLAAAYLATGAPIRRPHCRIGCGHCSLVMSKT